MKTIFGKKAQDIIFHPGRLILKWDVRKEDKGIYGKFNPL